MAEVIDLQRLRDFELELQELREAQSHLPSKKDILKRGAHHNYLLTMVAEFLVQGGIPRESESTIERFCERYLRIEDSRELITLQDLLAGYEFDDLSGLDEGEKRFVFDFLGQGIATHYALLKHTTHQGCEETISYPVTQVGERISEFLRYAYDFDPHLLECRYAWLEELARTPSKYAQGFVSWITYVGHTGERLLYVDLAQEHLTLAKQAIEYGDREEAHNYLGPFWDVLAKSEVPE
ncbi:hypothetical protein D6774_03630 [Candidatus Woesearchaeota archaeon]|nr:MAG: hypothetical protein D6774_03630 [Candidatus Woesearchaeota archaeon]